LKARLNLDRLHDGQVGRLAPLQDVVDILRGLPELIEAVLSMGRQASGFDTFLRPPKSGRSIEESEETPCIGDQLDMGR
jgi:hypothetical protein